MLGLIQPHLQLHSVLDLQVDQLRQLHRSTLLMDVDCTLKHHHSAILNPGVPEWMQSLQAAGIRLCLLSNGRGRRIEPLAQQYGLACVTTAWKPFPFGCWKALRRLGAEAEHTALIGDQLFADVMAGRMAGLFTILVRPTSSIEPWFTRMKRPLERRALAWMDRKSKNTTGTLQSLQSEIARSKPN
jgi:uncharacterized protein